jgi:signal transduction histidine kinase
MRLRAEEITLEGAMERLPTPAARDELQTLAETLNAMLGRIEAVLQRERAFVSDASHELRTPLAILKSEIELVRRTGGSKEELEAALDSAAEEVDQLVSLAEDLLVIARADQGRLPIRREAVEIESLLTRVRSRYLDSVGGARAEITVDADAAGSCEIDPLRIEQALGNLLDNALRHGSGGVGLHAERTVQGGLVLSVSDEGPGFSAEFENVAFERFSQASGARRDSGAGLGLSIVRAIAVAHGGTAAIATGERGGATVRMVLPANQPG